MLYTVTKQIDKGNFMSGINLPNILTIFRIFLIPILIITYYSPKEISYIASAGLFFLICFSDWLDGYLARKLQQESKFGAFLDPVADKLIVSVALCLLIQSFATPLFTIPAIIIISREILISALREWMAEFGKRTSVSVSFLGKVKTTAQMLAILFLLSQEPDFNNPVILTGIILLYLSVVLTIWTMLVYLYAAWREVRK